MTLKKNQKNKGMTYVELIVVLTIFSIISGITIFDYKKFEHRVEIKDLASIIASKITEAQKNAQAGRQTSNGVFTTLDSSKKPKPSYGIRLDSTATSNPSPNASFIYFADLDNDGVYNISNNCGVPITNDECLEKVEIHKGYLVKEIEFYDVNNSKLSLCPATALVDITFKRAEPNAGFKSTSCDISTASEVKIKIHLPTFPEISAIISVHQSGRIQIK